MSSYGIDTIKVGFKVEPSDLDLNNWTFKSQGKVKGGNEEAVSNKYYERYVTTPNGTVIHLKFVPEDYRHNQSDMLYIDFSLPKLVFGNNYQDIDDWEDAFRIANSAIAAIRGLPPLPDIRDATLNRIDLCANLQVGEENVSDYIEALHKESYPRRETKPYGKNGVIFQSDEISTCVYDKKAECNRIEATGILRYEITIRKKRKIAKYTGNPNPTLKDITKEMVHMSLIKDMETLHLNAHIISDRRNVHAILRAKNYSPSKIRNILGYLEVRRTMTAEQMKEEGLESRYYEQQLADAGISSLSIEGSKTLPALTLLLEEIEKKFSQSPSDTRKLRARSIFSKRFSETDLRSVFQNIDHLLLHYMSGYYSQPRGP